MMGDRRHFLKTAGVAGLAAAGRVGLAQGAAAGVQPGAGAAMSLSVRDFGAVGDGIAKDTVALQQTIDRVNVFGGGEAVVPAGTYLTGGIELRTGVTLRLEAGAVLRGSADLGDYKVGQVRWEGKWIQGYLGLICARDCQRIAVVGPGSIHGAPETGGRPTKDQPLRRPALVEPIGCQGVRLEGFSTDYVHMWSIHPANCEDVTITGLKIRSVMGNGDGIDVDSCRRVRIDACDIATGDDCISIKSGRGMEGYTLLRTSEDISITNCIFNDANYACIGIGSETSGGIRKVRISNCKFTGAKTFAVYIKSRPGRGAFIEDISVDLCDVAGTYGGGFLRINMANSGLQDEAPVEGVKGIPAVKNFRFSNIRIADVPVLVDGSALSAEKPLAGMVLENITGHCGRGITLANVTGFAVKKVEVTVGEGNLLSLTNVSGVGGKSMAAADDHGLEDNWAMAPIRDPRFGGFAALKKAGQDRSRFPAGMTTKKRQRTL